MYSSTKDSALSLDTLDAYSRPLNDDACLITSCHDHAIMFAKFQLRQTKRVMG